MAKNLCFGFHGIELAAGRCDFLKDMFHCQLKFF